MKFKMYVAGLWCVVGSYANAGVIQDQINVAPEGAVIIIAPGTYNETIDFLGKTITLRSAEGPEVTIIDGGGIDEVVVSCQGGSGATLDGFTICCGERKGMFIQGAAASTVVNCIFSDNEQHGMAVSGSSSTTIADCTFVANQGGGVDFAGASAVTVTGCWFVDNSGGFGGGMSVSNSASITNCVFIGNNGNFGGGVSVFGFSAAPVFTNCVFAGNIASTAGGAIHCEHGEPEFVNSVFYGNSAAVVGGAMFNQNFATPQVHNSILRNNTPTQIHDSDSLTKVTYSNVEGGWDGFGSHHNIDADPMFVDAADDDFRLLAGSPCIDAGTNLKVPADAADLDGDFDTAEYTPLDLDGNPRFADDPNTVDTGCTTLDLVVVDMGAYELPGDGKQPARGNPDIGRDGDVDAADLAAMLGAWGDCGECCLADLNYDEVVDAEDLAILLGAWG